MHTRLHNFSDALILAFGIIFAALLFSLMALAITGTPTDFEPVYAPDGTQANEWHGNIGTVGGGAGGGSNANPNDDTNGIHGIQAIKESKGRDADGRVPACNAHGGFNGVKKNCGG